MDDAGRKKLWEEYMKSRSTELREKIILEYAPLVKTVAGRLSMYLGYNVEYDDLVSYGIFGLIDAIDKFDTLKEVKFETYASLRIRGSILDQIRKMDWIPRTIRQKQKQIDAVENFCSQGVDAIILNAVDGSGIVPALETAEEKGIPVITVDMKPESGTFETYIGSDNFLGGELAAKWALKNLLQDKENAKVVFLTNPLSSAAIERIDGFKAVLAESAPNVEVVAEQGADTRETFMSTMEDILMANPEIDLVFSYSAQGGLGAYDAIQAAGREGEISVIGFDASAEEQDVIAEDGCYKGSIMQFPKELGKTCVESVTKVLNGETLEAEIGVEVGVYTKDGIIYAADLQ